MAVKRGRPPKKKEESVEEVVEPNVESVSKENEEKSEDVKSEEQTTREEIIDFMQPMEESTPIFNPLNEDVVEREYSSPKIADGVVDELDEPIFQQETYQDLTDVLILNYNKKQKNTMLI